MSAFEYQLSRSVRRRSISIVVHRGKVNVKAPIFVPKSVVQDFVDSKSHWVSKKLKQQEDWIEAEQQAKKRYEDGEIFLYLGEPLSLVVSTGSKSAVSMSEGQLHLTLSTRIKPQNRKNHCEKLIKQWYSDKLSEIIDESVALYSENMQVTPSEVVVRSYTRRWGSCSSRGVVSFNYLLAMAPRWVIEYVVVHELAHLVHMNHSPAFWALVERHYPNPKAAKDHLKEHGPVYLT